MSQATAPYQTHFTHLTKMQETALPSVPHMHFLHTLEGLARRAPSDPALATAPTGSLSFFNEHYAFSYEIDHAGRRIVVTAVRAPPATSG